LNETLKTPAEVVVIPAPTVVTGTATTVTQTTATLNATVNPNGANVTACEFEYGTTTSYGKTVACSTSPGAGTSAVSVSAPLSGLSPNTTYDYRISATNSTGTSKGLNETFKTAVEEVVQTGPTAETEIRQLLQEVITAKVPRGIRNELSGLLQEALRSLRPCRGFGGGPSGYGGHATPSVSALVAPLQAMTASRRNGCTTRQAFDDLEQFIAVIEHGQGRRRPQIPASLAAAWSHTAKGILASLSSGSHGWPGYTGER
jgi:hypothetical protein